MDQRENERLTKFVSKFSPHLFESQRWEAFLYLAAHLFKINSPYIVETGCARQDGNWIGDGQSTLIWDYIISVTSGGGCSVDLSEDSIKLARKNCPHIELICSDSIKFMTNNPKRVGWADLLYLDSYDHNPPYALSELHHAGELAAAWPNLKSGCLIAVDDCHSLDSGKHFFVDLFFSKMGINPLVRSYITIWRKP